MPHCFKGEKQDRLTVALAPSDSWRRVYNESKLVVDPQI
jgi:hypothetical protein